MKATGHRDCCGDMIHEGDTVFTRHGEATIIWDREAWRMKYTDGHLEPLNCWDSSNLRRCDNSVTMKNIVTGDGVTKKSIVTGLSQVLSQSENAEA